MRHHNCTWHEGTFRSFTTRNGVTITAPYNNGNRTYAKPDVTRRYIQIIQYVADHPGCKRPEIYEAVFGGKFSHGSQSEIFSELLYDDLIDYDTKTFKYVATPKGMKLLKVAYLRSMEKLVKGEKGAK